jgi:Na+-transporting methylmalonyl-CoA/oxaloacetate decarboxylase gamma subunit
VSIRDALIVSLVGMSVVFVGLVVTSWLISAIALVPAWAGRRRPAPVPAPAPPVPAADAPLPAVTPTPDPDTAAVIATLLDVELRLYGGERPARFTFRHDPAAPDWRGGAALRTGQPIKGAR